MRKTFFLLSLVVLGTAGFTQIRSAKLQASGLTCAMCARAVYKNLEALPFISKIDTDLNGSAFLLEFNGKPVDPDAIRKKVEDAGFSVASLDLTARFDNVNIEADKHIAYQGLMFHFMGGKKTNLSGDQVIRVVDKSFLLAKEQKKMQGMTKKSCYSTGTMADCCVTEGKPETKRVYHLILVS